MRGRVMRPSLLILLASAAVPRSLGQSLSLRAAAAAQRHARHQPGGGHPRAADERVTAVLNTFKRPDMLRRAVEHYTQCDVVDAVRVVWTEGGTPPATDGWRIGGAAGVDGAPRVQFDVLPDSLNSRFTPLPALRTRAIFAVDDDVEARARWAWMWREPRSSNPDRLQSSSAAGFVRRPRAGA